MHSHTLVPEFHDSTCEEEQPPTSLTPSDVSSRPEFEFVVADVPDVTISTESESSPTVIPFPAPIFRVTDPGPVPIEETPDPAIIEVIA